MSDKDDSAVHKLATIAANAVKAVETEIDSALSKADAELLKGPAHFGDSETDAFGFHAELPVDDAIPLITQNDSDASPNEKKP
jgi:hypothetical protein